LKIDCVVLKSAGIMMLTSDISLTKDSSYLQLVKQFANDANALADAFSHAWYKLTTRDMGPVSRCLKAPGVPLPPPQPFQYPLPAGPANQAQANWDLVRTDVLNLIHPTQANANVPADLDAAGKPYYGAMFVQLAYLCAATYRRSDYLGGCNGARIRYYTGWPVHAGVDKVLSLLTNLQQSKYQDTVSLSDLIVFAGNVALEDAAGQTGWLPFCPGRVDVASNDGGWDNLRFSSSSNYSSTDAEIRIRLSLLGLSQREFVALAGRPRSAQLMGANQFTAASWTLNPSQLSNAYFNTLLNNDWSESTSSNGVVEFHDNVTPDDKLRMTPSDLALKYAPDFLAIAQEFAADSQAFQAAFASAWTKLMNADRFDGPGGNVCTQV
jgi:catalase (peroxidase I)